jgi:hypothetical protein
MTDWPRDIVTAYLSAALGEHPLIIYTPNKGEKRNNRVGRRREEGGKKSIDKM